MIGSVDNFIFAQFYATESDYVKSNFTPMLAHIVQLKINLNEHNIIWLRTGSEAQSYRNKNIKFLTEYCDFQIRSTFLNTSGFFPTQINISTNNKVK